MRTLTYLALLPVLLFYSWPPIGPVQAANIVVTSVTAQRACGDGFIERATTSLGVPEEICDKGDPDDPSAPEQLDGFTCQSFIDPTTGQPWQSGALHCASDCNSFDQSLCYTCPNNHKEQSEECDGSDFGGATCITYGFGSGNLLCMANCRLNLVNCVAASQNQGGGGFGPSGGNSGSGNFNPGALTQYGETKVVAKGKAYPNADVHVLLDGKVLALAKADNKADFYFESNQIPPGVGSLGFWSEDASGLKSTLMTVTFRVTYGAVTNLNGVFIAPSIDTDKKAVKKGEQIKIFGKTVPDSNINVHVNSAVEHIASTNSSNDGSWTLDFDTTPLEEEDYHTAKALFAVQDSGSEVKSGFSRSVTFHVGRPGGAIPCPEADLNKDKRVNITDFSILLYYWGTDNSCADQNQNKKVDLVDFSIMMYYWTG